LRDLNAAQRAAVEYGVSDATANEGPGPLLSIAGAGTGKTNTLAHRVAHIILSGAAPGVSVSPRMRGWVAAKHGGLLSWWGLLVIAAMMPALLWRLLDEEKFLTSNLPGYAEYQSKVRYRLIPLLW
jgi:hypothetical protein